MLCDFPAILIAGALATYALFKLRRGALAFVAGAGGVALILFFYNAVAFGSPFFLSYQAYKFSVNSQFPDQAVGFVGLTYPRLRLLWDILIDPQRGLFFCNPVTDARHPGGWFSSWHSRHRAEFAVVIVTVRRLPSVQRLLRRDDHFVGRGHRDRAAANRCAIPFMVLALAFLPSAWDYILAPLALVSAFVMLMATAVEPHLPYEYLNPLRAFVWPAYLRADFAYNRSPYFGGPPIAGDSVAFNLGKLSGLPGAAHYCRSPQSGLARRCISCASWRRTDGLASENRGRGARDPGAVRAANGGCAAGASRARREHGLLGRYYRGCSPTAPERISSGWIGRLSSIRSRSWARCPIPR